MLVSRASWNHRVLLFTCLALAVISFGCASTPHQSADEFKGDPLQYLGGEWYGQVTLNFFDSLGPERFLTIYPSFTYAGEAGLVVGAEYGVTGRTRGAIQVQVVQFDGSINISFRVAGSLSVVRLTLYRMGDDLVLSGRLNTLNTDAPPYPLILRKKK